MYTVYSTEENIRKEIEGLLSTQDLFSTTDVLCIRLPLAYKIIYKKFVREDKQRMELLKKSIGAAIAATAKLSGAEIQKISEASQIVVNLNVHHIEQKIEQRSEIDDMLLRRAENALDQLLTVVEALEKQQVVYRYAILNYAKEIRRAVNDLKKLIEVLKGS
ncbi:hypothetical protein Pyrde_1888 [Pyrodictium delaneyi]|uniref:Uncharacterized protein n=1 Tax=Pyrodictium delaneyi TaxID=1273541 RepID=A0A0P0N5P7_9CREN|nr:hypothetical protein [Pyrodictium delaneyi]ALL01931.1 hypothetical protein Pyrde_1888 [Pyrodictium delaneyi]